MGYSREKANSGLRGGRTIQHPLAPDFFFFFSLLDTPQNFAVTPLEDFKA